MWTEADTTSARAGEMAMLAVLAVKMQIQRKVLDYYTWDVLNVRDIFR
jgi:hypothetical protein